MTDNTEVIVSTTGSSSGLTVCHEIDYDEDGNAVPRCRVPGTYRTVDPTVYPTRRPCSSGRCWDDGIPDEVSLEWSDDADTQGPTLQELQDAKQRDIQNPNH